MEIKIVSGEGNIGTVETYLGKQTPKAIAQRLTRERSGGDRWARAELFSHYADDGKKIYIDFETGQYR